MESFVLLIPLAPVQPEAVLGQRSQVDDAEIAAVAWPSVRVVGRGFAEVVKAGPDELTERPVISRFLRGRCL